MIRWLCRWLVPAALAAAAGVALAIWTEGRETSRFGHPPAPAADESSPSSGTLAPAAAPGGRAEPVPSQATAAPTSRGTNPHIRAERRSTDRSDSKIRRLEGLARRLEEQARQDAEAALAALLALEERARDRLAENVVRQAAEHAHERTIGWLEQNVIDLALRERLLAHAYAGTAAHAPTFGLNAAQTLTDPETRRLATHQVIEVWAEQDPVAAFEWVRSREGDGAADLLATVMRAYAEEFPAQAGDVVASLPQGAPRDRLIGQYAASLAESDAAAAMAWLSDLPADATTQTALGQVFERWAQQDPWTAMEHAASVDGELAFELVGKVAAGMGERRPEELAASLEQVPEGVRSAAAHHLARSWSLTDPQRAREWVETLAAPDVRDQALRGLSDGGR